MALVLALIVTGTPLASAARLTAVAQQPKRDLTFDYFMNYDNDKPKKTAEIEGITYLCCCRQEGEEVECRLSDMTSKVNPLGLPGKCKTHLGKGWTSWYNVGKSKGSWLWGRQNNKKDKLGEEDGQAQACKIPEEDMPKPTTTTTTTITTTTTKVVETELPDAMTTITTETTETTTTTTTTTVTTTTVTTTTSSTTTTTTERMQIIDMSLNGDPDDAFTVIGYKTYKCCCHSDVIANVKASKEIECELFNVESGSEDVATGYLTKHKTGCKQMAAKKYGDGGGWHAYNKMGKKYSGLEFYNKCAVPN